MEAESRIEALEARRGRLLGLTSREVNLALEVLMVVVIVSGLLSWVAALDRAWVFTTVHSIGGFSVLALAPLKLRGSVRTGWRAGRFSRLASATFGFMVVAGLALGVLHTTRIWWGLGYWEAMWTHLLLGFLSIPLFLWHVMSRPVRPGRVDVHRRSLLTWSAAVAAGVTVWGSQEAVFRVTGAKSKNRAGTGSHELASFDPDNMPSKIWIDDTAPTIAMNEWDLRIEGQPVTIDELREQTESLAAWLDCTDGWRSEQRWDVVSLAKVLSDRPGRSVKVTSATGYARLFSREDAEQVFLSVGYDGRPLRRGHGAPVRIVAPNRRGPWWIKWVTEVELSDRPAWVQLPFPAT